MRVIIGGIYFGCGCRRAHAKHAPGDKVYELMSRFGVLLGVTVIVSMVTN